MPHLGSLGLLSLLIVVSRAGHRHDRRKSTSSCTEVCTLRVAWGARSVLLADGSCCDGRASTSLTLQSLTSDVGPVAQAASPTAWPHARPRSPRESQQPTWRRRQHAERAERAKEGCGVHTGDCYPSLKRKDVFCGLVSTAPCLPPRPTVLPCPARKTGLLNPFHRWGEAQTSRVTYPRPRGV